MTRAEWRRILVEVQRLAMSGHAVLAIKYFREYTHCDLHDAYAQVKRLINAPRLRDR